MPFHYWSNASLLNKSIRFLKKEKKNTDLKLLNKNNMPFILYFTLIYNFLVLFGDSSLTTPVY